MPLLISRATTHNPDHVWPLFGCSVNNVRVTSVTASTTVRLFPRPAPAAIPDNGLAATLPFRGLIQGDMVAITLTANSTTTISSFTININYDKAALLYKQCLGAPPHLIIGLVGWTAGLRCTIAMMVTAFAHLRQRLMTNTRRPAVCTARLSVQRVQGCSIAHHSQCTQRKY
jgi:hypothetical protein